MKDMDQGRAAFNGRYEITSDYIYYWEDTGFETDGSFKDKKYATL
jgi:hypothetical protein